MAGVIDNYLSQLERRLSFDTSLAKRFRTEVEDHLREAAESEPHLSRDEAESRAIRRFGAPDDLARQIAVDSLSRLTARTWIAFGAAALAVFLTMRLRHLQLDPTAFDAAPVAALLDRYGFMAAIVAAVAGWLALRTRGAFSVQRFGAALLVAAVCAATLIASIAGGATIGLGSGRQFELAMLCALLVETAMAGWLAAHVWGLARRVSATSRALKG